MARRAKREKLSFIRARLTCLEAKVRSTELQSQTPPIKSNNSSAKNSILSIEELMFICPGPTYGSCSIRISVGRFPSIFKRMGSLSFPDPVYRTNPSMEQSSGKYP